MEEKVKLNKSYDETFKCEAVRLVVEEGRRAMAVERDLGISKGSISHWKRILQQGSVKAFPGKGYRRPEDEELYQLRKENDKLRTERDILKKAVAIFSVNR